MENDPSQAKQSFAKAISLYNYNTYVARSGVKYVKQKGSLHLAFCKIYSPLFHLRGLYFVADKMKIEDTTYCLQKEW